MEYNHNEWKIFAKWTIKKIAFIGILIALSVVFLVISVNLLPIVSIPTFKISFIGLPIKISGFIFGPIVGALVGLISDILSLIYAPNYYHPLYTVAAMVDGIVAGLVGILYMRLLKYYFGGNFMANCYENRAIKLYKRWVQLKDSPNVAQRKLDKLTNKVLSVHEKRKKTILVGTKHTLLNINMFTAILILVILCMIIFYVVQFKVPDSVLNKGFVSNRTFNILIMTMGFFSMIVFIVIARFVMKPKWFLIMVPIVVFSALIEFINVPLLSLADVKSSSLKMQDIFIYIFQHTWLSPFKIWGNMFIIMFTYNIVARLIFKNSNITY